MASFVCGFYFTSVYHVAAASVWCDRHNFNMTSRSFAIIAGAGPGTGAALALRFAKTYPVVLLARSPESFNRTVDDILSQGGQAFGIAADVSSRLDLTRAYDEIRSKLGQDAACAVSESSNRDICIGHFVHSVRLLFTMLALGQHGRLSWK